MSEKLNNKAKIQILILVIFVVLMPLGSWFYLQSGYDYNRSLMLELQNYGKVPAFALINQHNDTITNDDLLGKYFVANFYSAKRKSGKATMDYARRILGQFESQHDFYFVSHSLNPVNVSAQALKDFAESEDLNIPRALFLSGEKKDLLSLLNIGYKIPILEERKPDGSLPLKSNINQLPEEYPYLVLVDSSLTILNYYDANDESSVRKLVEHLAVILPRDKREKAELRRRKEK